MGEAMHAWGKSYMENLYTFPSQFCYEYKIPIKIANIKIAILIANIKIGY